MYPMLLSSAHSPFSAHIQMGRYKSELQQMAEAASYRPESAENCIISPSKPWSSLRPSWHNPEAHPRRRPSPGTRRRCGRGRNRAVLNLQPTSNRSRLRCREEQEDKMAFADLRILAFEKIGEHNRCRRRNSSQIIWRKSLNC